MVLNFYDKTMMIKNIVSFINRIAVVCSSNEIKFLQKSTILFSSIKSKGVKNLIRLCAGYISKSKIFIEGTNNKIELNGLIRNSNILVFGNNNQFLEVRNLFFGNVFCK